MIEPDESMMLKSDYSDEELRIIAELLGPDIKDMLLLPAPVVVRL